MQEKRSQKILLICYTIPAIMQSNEMQYYLNFSHINLFYYQHQ